MTTKNGSVPFMRFGNVNIHQMKDLPSGSIKITRLTKWLPATQKELKYLTNEYTRIKQDPNRFAMVVYHNGEVALYVDDVTGGAFDKMSEDEE